MTLAGARLGRYEVLRLLGEGGMGRVFLARDSVLGREVAVKVLRDDLGLPAEVRAHLTERLRLEARAVAAVSHPHVVVLHDMGDDEAAGLFLVFEYVDGETLRARIAKGPLPLAEVARIARELADALDAAHASGVIHRDVKPENVFLAKSGCKIGDFGLARIPDASVTKSGAGVVGTPAYAAPETLRGGAFSPASDEFALAATLYEAITGRRAFPGDDLLSVATAIGADTPRPIAREDLDPLTVTELNRAIVERGLAKAPEARFATVGELGRAVSRALSSNRAGATGATSAMPGRAPRWLNFLVAAGFIGGLAVIVFERRHHLADAADAGAAASASAKAKARAPKTSALLPSAVTNHATGPDASASPSTASSAAPVSSEERERALERVDPDRD